MQKDIRFRNINSVIVKVTQRCNLDCKYCYENVSKKGHDMELQVFMDLIDKIMLNSINKRILVIFHGGEPTLLSNDWYENAVEYANRKASEFGKRIAFAMQSNVLSLNSSKIDLLKQLQISLGVSIDGPLTITGDSLRGKENLTLQNLRKLSACGIEVGILSTINHFNYDKFRSIAEWFSSELGITSFKANVAYSVGAGHNIPALSKEQITRAQLDLLDYMIETKGQKILESNLCFEIKRFFEQDDKENTISLCDDRVCGAGKRVLGVNFKGELLPCGRFEWNESRYDLGSLEGTGDSVYDPFKDKVQSFHDEAPETWQDCKSCVAKKVCRYSCQAFIVRSKSKKNIECAPMKSKYDYFLRNMKGLLPVYKQFTKNQVTYIENTYC